jgi:ankyrin repeat protein
MTDTEQPDNSERDTQDAIAALTAGDATALRGVLERRPTPSHSDGSHRQLLELAVREGQLEAVQILLEAGTDPGATTFDGESLTEIAAYRGHDAIAALLEEASARARRVTPSETHDDHPIHLAAEAGDLSRVRTLLDGDPALVHRSDRAGGTPLHRAVIGHSPQVVALLLDRGADIHAVHGAGLGSASGYAPEDLQPIDLALWGGPQTIRPSPWRMLRYSLKWLRSRWGRTRRQPCDVATARLLLARGASYDLTVASALGDMNRVAAILDAEPARISETRPNLRRPLSAAVEFGHERIVRLLLERGADPTWPDADGSPRGAALHAAARAGDRRLVELLLAHGADPNGYVDAAGNATFAARTPELRALLIAHGGKVDPYDLVWLNADDEVMRRVTSDPDSAHAGCGGVFTAVCTRGKRDLLARLLEAGIRVPPVAGGCQSYLLEQPDMLRELLARGGLSPDYPTPEGMTLLHALCRRDIRGRTMGHRTECGAILLDAGATISAKDKEYRSTPLAWAARNNLPDMVDFLLARGAPTNLPDDEPWATPLAWAERRGHKEIAARLRRHGATRVEPG